MYLRLSLLQFLVYAPLGAFWPLFTLRLDKLGFTPLEIALASATQAVGALFAPLLAGQVADRWLPAERCLSLFAFLAAGLLLVLPLCTTPGEVFLVSLAMWMLAVPIMTLGNTVTFSLLPPGGSFSRVRMWGTVGWVVESWIVGLALRQSDWHIELADSFRFAAAGAILLSLYAHTLPSIPPRVQAPDLFAPLAALRLLRRRDFAVYFACNLLLCLTLPFATQNTALLLDELAVIDAWKGPALTIAQVTEVLSLLLMPSLLRRTGQRLLMTIGAASWALSLSVLAVGRPTGLVVSCLLLNGLFITGFVVTGQMFVNRHSSGDVRASAQALISFTTGVGMLAGYGLSGWVRHAAGGELQPTFAVGALVALLATAFFVVGFRLEPTASASDRGREESLARARGQSEK